MTMKRLICAVLTLVLLLSLSTPLTVLAAEEKAVAAETAYMSPGIENIVKRAYQMTSIQWTPLQNIVGWRSGFTYKAGTTYTGLPYGQPVNACYVPWDASFEEFLTAVNNSKSKMYTSYSDYNGRAPYYSVDCSGFVSWAWDLPSRKHTGNIANYATLISTSSYAKAQIGDCLLKSGYHVALITDIAYDSNGKIIGIEICEAANQTATNYCTQRQWYTSDHSWRNMEFFQKMYFGDGYSLYRCNTRDSVTYTHSCVVPLEGDVCAKCGVGMDKFDIFGANMSLGNDLTMYFYVEKAKVQGQDYFIEIVKESDGAAAVTTTIPFARWISFSDSLYQVALDGVAAKEMADAIHVTVYNGQGKAVSRTWTDSIRDYCIRQLNNPAQKSVHTLLADMLNYGAAAQVQFSYNLKDLANSTMTSAHKACATSNFSMGSYGNHQVKGEGYVGTSLSLESNIVLTFFFNAIESENYMSARVRYADHYGNEVSTVIGEGNFIYLENGMLGINVNTLVVADMCQLISCEIYDGDVLVASAADSVESYAVRMASGNDINRALMIFAASAYEYLH